MTLRLPASLGLTVLWVLLGFAATLSAINVFYHVPLAERTAEEEVRKRLAQEISRLQSSLEYFLLKGDVGGAQREVAVLANNHDYVVAALADDKQAIIAATRRAWLGRATTEVVAEFDPTLAEKAVRERRAQVVANGDASALLAYASILLGTAPEELRPTRVGSLFLSYDLSRSKAEVRGQVLRQSLYWSGWVTTLALALWLVFHFLLTRRAAQLMRAAEQLAAGNLHARAGVRGEDELGRLGRAFDTMASVVAETQTRLRNDITERKRVTEALRISEESYRAIFDASEDAIFVLDVETAAVVDLNPKAATSYGYSSEEMRQIDLGTLSSGLPQYTRQDAKALIVRALANEQLRAEWHCKSKDGSFRWDEIFFKRVIIGGENRLLALSREITDRKLAEDALRASEEQYRAMFNASIDGLALWNAAGDRVDANPALWRMYGYADGKSSESEVANKVGPDYEPEFQHAVAAGQARHMELTASRQDGSPLELEVHGIPMQYQGQPHVLTIARDITEKKRAENELMRQRDALYQREKLAALGSLLAGVAHELNNPLSVVVARAVLLEEKGEPAVQSAAQKIRIAAERCARIVRTFLAMARQQRPERGPVAINEVITAALDITAYSTRTSGVEVSLDLTDDIPQIHADADQLHQVLLNLIVNAQQALQEQTAPRRLRLASRFDATANKVRITVADNGPGIPQEVRARVFEPYFTTKPMGLGTGVGLAVSSGIVGAHGGTLMFDCPSEGGTVFTIELPVSNVDAIDAKTKPSQEVGADQQTVLVVDDEDEIRETLAEILTSARHRVVGVASGREALEQLAAQDFDVILTDIRMPDLDGRALYQEIQKRWPERTSRVAFVTGDTLASNLHEFATQSKCPVIEKPFLPDEVRRVVAKVTSNTGENNRVKGDSKR